MPLAPPPESPPAIVVTGEGLGPARGEAAYDVAVIDRDRLTDTASGRLEDALKDVAGFAEYRRSDSRSAHPTSQGATLRGLGGNASSRALVVLDGVPQIDPFGGWVTFTAFDPARLGEVRVTRGGGSGLYGPGALAGTIDIRSAGPEDLAPVAASLLYGSRNSIDADASVASRLGNGFATLSANYQRGDGFVPIVARQRGTIDQAAPYRQGSIDGRAVIPVAPGTELQANLLLLRDERSRGLPGTGNSSTGADASLRLVGRGRWGFEALGYVQLRKFTSGFASANASRTAATETLDQFDVPATGVGGRLLVKPPLPNGIELQAGLDGRQTGGETDEFFSYSAGRPTRIRNAGGETATAGLFADLSAPVGDRLILTAGGRVDRWWIGDGKLLERAIASATTYTSTRYPNRDGTETTGRAGASYRLGRGFRLRGAAYLGWRLPTLNELYRPFRAGLDATAANPALSPERLKGFDGGIDWEPLPSVHVAATGFHNVLDHAIGNITLGQGPGTFPQVGFVAAGGVFRQRGNLDAIVSNGAELEGRVTDGRWRFSASYAFTDAHVRGSGPSAGLNGLRPAQTPRNQLSATIGREEVSGLSASATVRYVSAQFENDQNSLVDKGATTLDLTGSVPVGHGFALTARAENVTGTLVYATVNGDGTIERATPRTLWIGFRFRR